METQRSLFDRSKDFLIITMFFILAFGILVLGATTKEKTEALERAQLYLVQSDGSVWNASDFMGISYFAKKYPLSIMPSGIAIDSKKIFDQEKYAFTASLLKQNVVAPTPFELSLGTPETFFKTISCEDFSNEDFTKMGASVNTIENPYDATHAIFFLEQISETYTALCGKPGQAGTAETMKQLAKSGLVLDESMNKIPGWFDAYLSQECARGIVEGIIPAPVTDLVVASQDMNVNEKLTYGGWYHAGKRLNEPYDLGEFWGGWYYPELPNGHTSVMATCILLIDLGVSQ